MVRFFVDKQGHKMNFSEESHKVLADPLIQGICNFNSPTAQVMFSVSCTSTKLWPIHILWQIFYLFKFYVPVRIKYIMSDIQSAFVLV